MKIVVLLMNEDVFEDRKMYVLISFFILFYWFVGVCFFS